MTRKRTKTSSFGVSKREGHDASRFYQSKLYNTKSTVEKRQSAPFHRDNSYQIPQDLFISPTIGKTLLSLRSSIPDASVHLSIVSLPVLKAADCADIMLWKKELWKMIYAIQQKLLEGGRCIVILDNLINLSPTEYQYYPLHREITLSMIEEGWLMRGEIIWTHLNFHSFHSLTDLQSNYSHILIFSYQRFKRTKKTLAQLDPIDTIAKENFLRDTKSVWLPAQSLNEREEIHDLHDLIGDLSVNTDVLTRLMELYSFKDDVVLLTIPRMDSERNLQSLFPLSNVRHRTLFHQYKITK